MRDIYFLYPVRGENNYVSEGVAKNYYRTSNVEFSEEDGYVGADEPNLSDYLYGTVKLLLTQKLVESKVDDDTEERIYEIISKIDNLLDSIYEEESEYLLDKSRFMDDEKVIDSNNYRYLNDSMIIIDELRSIGLYGDIINEQ